MRIVWMSLLLAGVVFAQDVTEPTTTSAAPPGGAAKPGQGADDKSAAQGADNADPRADDGEDAAEECEEAWEYLEFLKTNIKLVPFSASRASLNRPLFTAFSFFLLCSFSFCNFSFFLNNPSSF